MRKLRILIFIVILLIIIIYFVGQKKVEAAKVTVEITRGAPFTHLNESERDGLIGDISLGKIYTREITIQKGTDMYMPGISVGLFSNKIMISDWISVPIRDKGTYELTLGLTQPPPKNETISIAVYVNDDKGKVIIGKKQDVIWD